MELVVVLFINYGVVIQIDVMDGVIFIKNVKIFKCYIKSLCNWGQRFSTISHTGDITSFNLCMIYFTVILCFLTNLSYIRKLLLYFIQLLK